MTCVSYIKRRKESNLQGYTIPSKLTLVRWSPYPRRPPWCHMTPRLAWNLQNNDRDKEKETMRYCNGEEPCHCMLQWLSLCPDLAAETMTGYCTSHCRDIEQVWMSQQVKMAEDIIESLVRGCLYERNSRILVDLIRRTFVEIPKLALQRALIW